MATYRVLYKPEPAMSGTLERTQFIRDRFSLPAFVFPLFWLLWYRQWYAAVFMVIAAVAIGLVTQNTVAWVGLPLNMLAGLAVALEGPTWRISALRRAGYSEIGSVEAQSLEEAELRFFLDSDGAPSVEAAKPLAPVAPGPATDMFFPAGGRS